MYTPNRDDDDGDDNRVSRHVAANIVANGGRFYEDETWATAETPAPYLTGGGRPQTGYENSQNVAGGGQNVTVSQDDDDDYTYANEANDEGSVMDSAYIAALAASASSSRRRSQASKASTPTTELDDDGGGDERGRARDVSRVREEVSRDVGETIGGEVLRERRKRGEG